MARVKPIRCCASLRLPILCPAVRPRAGLPAFPLLLLALLLGGARPAAALEYPGPRVPVRHTFPSAGRYRLFFQFAPGGEVLLVPFVLDVVADDGRVDTRIESIVKLAGAAP